MIDIRALREDPDGVKAALARRGVEAAEVDAVLEADVEHREWQRRFEARRAEVKELSRQVGQAKKAGDDDRAEELRAQSLAVGEDERAASGAADAAAELRQDGAALPAQHPGRRGTGRHGRRGQRRDPSLVARAGQGRPEPERLEHQQVPHWEIGEALQLLDMERGARLAGSMFPLYRGAGARLLRALTAFAIDRHAPDYEEIRPPTVVLTDTMTSTGHLPKFADDAYHVERDDLWLIPTAEVPLTCMHRGEILEESQLPMRFTASTACYRREAGSAGRDTRGLLRVHEFDKVELFAYATPDGALDAQADILRAGRVHAAGARAALPGARPVRGRPRRLLGPYLRPRGVLAGCRPLARGSLGQLVPRLPGPSGQRAIPARGRRIAPARAHGERLGAGLASYLGRAGRERAPGGRYGRLPEALAPYLGGELLIKAP